MKPGKDEDAEDAMSRRELNGCDFETAQKLAGGLPFQPRELARPGSVMLDGL
jgi:hypothetical protein